MLLILLFVDRLLLLGVLRVLGVLPVIRSGCCSILMSGVNFPDENPIDDLSLLIRLDRKMGHKIRPHGMKLVNITELQIRLRTKMLFKYLRIILDHASSLLQHLVLVK